MVDWTIFSPTFLAAVVEWAGAVVTVLAVALARRRQELSWVARPTRGAPCSWIVRRAPATSLRGISDRIRLRIAAIGRILDHALQHRAHGEIEVDAVRRNRAEKPFGIGLVDIAVAIDGCQRIVGHLLERGIVG